MIVQSTRLGQLNVNTEDILRFSQGLPGFPEEKSFILVGKTDSPFTFLQSGQNPDLTFVIVDPFAFFHDYEFTIDDATEVELQLSEECPPHIYNIVTIPKKTEEMTANLLAPVIVNSKKRLAKQIVLEKVAYTTRHRLFPTGFPQKTDEGGK